MLSTPTSAGSSDVAGRKLSYEDPPWGAPPVAARGTGATARGGGLREPITLGLACRLAGRGSTRPGWAWSEGGGVQEPNDPDVRRRFCQGRAAHPPGFLWRGEKGGPELTSRSGNALLQHGPAFETLSSRPRLFNVPTQPGPFRNSSNKETEGRRTTGLTQGCLRGRNGGRRHLTERQRVQGLTRSLPWRHRSRPDTPTVTLPPPLPLQASKERWGP